jgi:formyltetrahydrofolate hydrolase
MQTGHQSIWTTGISQLTNETAGAQVRKGKDMERVVLARALRWFLQDRVLVDTTSNRTVLFE